MTKEIKSTRLTKIMAQGFVSKLLSKSNPKEEEVPFDDLKNKDVLQETISTLKKHLKENPDRETVRGLSKVEQKLAKAADKLAGVKEDDDDDEDHTTPSSFPNLKYAKPKYKNMESVLKYVDDDGDAKAVKLVIMNFND